MVKPASAYPATAQRAAGRWRTVRVFISSTFRDLQAERDHLVKIVFPALRERLQTHRVHLVDIDLRWGVTQEQCDDDRATELCLAQVDACRPFFLCILGARYGYVPTRRSASCSRMARRGVGSRARQPGAGAPGRDRTGAARHHAGREPCTRPCGHSAHEPR